MLLNKIPVILALAGVALTAATRKQCVIEHTDNVDDTPAMTAAFTECRENADIIFDVHHTYNAWTPVSFLDLKNVKVHINGNIELPKDIATVQRLINVTLNQPSTYATPWFYFHGSDVTLLGSTNPSKGWINGFGQQWWDIGQRILRPQLATFNVTTGLMQDLKVYKPIAWGFNIPGTNVQIKNHHVDARPTNSTREITTSFPFNTDGLNLSGQNITLDGYWGENGDDCVSVVDKARNIIAKNGYCGFSSHGLSIGSLGRNGSVQTVANVLFENWVMDGAVYGARFKSWTGGQGWAENITWKNIEVVNVSTPIFVTQNYFDQDKGPRPNNTNATSTHLNNIRFENFHGTINPNPTDGTCISSPCWNFVEGADGTQGIIFDLYNGTATNILAKKINVAPIQGTSSQTTVICDPTTLVEGEADTLGFVCQKGLYIPT